MLVEHVRLLEIASDILQSPSRDKIEIFEIADAMGIRVVEAFHMVESRASTGHVKYHTAGGFYLTGTPSTK